MKKCYLCGYEGNILYRDLNDNSFKVDEVWSYYKCTNRNCELIWIEPIPELEVLKESYTGEYYTHTVHKDNLKNELIMKIRTSAIGAKLGFIIYLQDKPKGSLLDVGCGNGHKLEIMNRLGWEVEGLDPDPEAVRAAKENYEHLVHQGTLEDVKLAKKRYDAIILSHVIEHIPDPLPQIKKCYQLLRPGGHIAISCPNSDSMGHRLFKAGWYGIDTPRHAFLYSGKNLEALLREAGFSICDKRTSILGSRSTFLESYRTSEKGKQLVPSKRKRIAALLFSLIEFIAILFFDDIGEELEIVCVKNK